MLIECRCDQLLPARDYHKIIAMNPTEHQPGLLLEKIAIELFAADETDAPLPVFALILERGKLLHGKLDLHTQPTLGFEPALADIRVVEKVSDRQA
jgi:hypothetical protein